MGRLIPTLLLALAACAPAKAPRVDAYDSSKPARATASPASAVNEHVVARGETVHGIAQRYGLGVRALIDANGLSPPYVLEPGQRLKLPEPREYTVATGDTVYGIARRERVPMAELVRVNGIEPPYTIRVGQALRLPDHAAVPSHTIAATPPLEPKPADGGKVLAKPVEREPVAPSAPPSAEPPLASPLPTTQQAALPPPAAVMPPSRGGSGFAWPVRGEVLSRFGPKIGGLHNDGINIAAPKGTPVHAAENGVVAYAGNELRGFGNLVLIRHAGGWITAYAHIDSIQVKRGDLVDRGDAIGKVGDTGNVAAPQLHFEIRRKGEAQDPLPLLEAGEVKRTELSPAFGPGVPQAPG
jgi:murein DD-endopeptidase MepM/ murein hydrolase activator NlpD